MVSRCVSGERGEGGGGVVRWRTLMHPKQRPHTPYVSDPGQAIQKRSSTNTGRPLCLSVDARTYECMYMNNNNVVVNERTMDVTTNNIILLLITTLFIRILVGCRRG